MARERDQTIRDPAEGGMPLGVRDYKLMGLIALLLVTVVLLHDGMSYWSAVVLLLGLVSLQTSWSIGPPLLMMVLTILMVFRNRITGNWASYRQRIDPLTDVALAVGMLAYVAAQYRLMTLVRRGRPFDGRRHPRATEGVRSPALVTGREVVYLLVSVGTFALAAFIGWRWLWNELWYPLVRVPRDLWFALVLLWIFAVALLVASALLGYLRWASASGMESLLYLQDQAWAATRGEQRRLQRWLVWARLRKERP